MARGDGSAERPYRLAVIAGDGVGPEVMAQALRILELVAEKRGLRFALTRYPFGSEHYLRTNETFPPEALEEIRGHDAVLLGAIGDPRIETGLLERAIIAGLRFGLDLYINLRPVKLYAEHLCPLKGITPADIDMMVVRENTEDLYTGMGGHFKRGTPDEVALQEMILTRKGADRLFRYAYELARSRERKKLTLVDKANAVRAFDLWRRAFAEIGAEYPDVSTNCQYVDAACMNFVRDPGSYDVIVTSNVFGDIVTDLGAMIAGGMGLAASGNLHPGQVSLFEPIHGSAPDIAGKNQACPLAAILSIQMLLDYLGHPGEGRAIEAAVEGALVELEIPSAQAGNGLSTQEMGKIVARRVAALL
ncbi:MAG: 3-isopropylmalate dehydrogenase [Candidatus Eisenbacteria bacterium]|nr:3-isopropylmalate dehydrogenase [Candidatus Eisenbacteria bacterium]MCC7142476.1 3-isopropylmalate dehydrogenase [Candidatus Eisenbacteria bacterium]